MKMKGIISVASVLVLTSALHAEDKLFDRCFKADGKYWMATLPAFVLASEAERLEWSDDGRFLIVYGATPARKPSLLQKALGRIQTEPPRKWVYIWNKKWGKGKEVFRESRGNKLLDIGLCNGTNRGYATIRSGETPEGVSTTAFYRLDMDSDPPLKLILAFEPGKYAFSTVSPTMDFAFVQAAFTPKTGGGTTYEHYLITPTGLNRLDYEKPPGAKIAIIWTRDGFHMPFHYFDGVKRSTWIALNLKRWSNPASRSKLPSLKTTWVAPSSAR